MRTRCRSRGYFDHGLLLAGIAVTTLSSACQEQVAAEGEFTEPPADPGNSAEDLANDAGGWPAGMSVVCQLGASQGLVGYWSADDGLSDSAGNNDGIVVPLGPTGEYGALDRQPPTGEAASIAPGYEGEAYDFDGTSFIEIPDAPLFNPTLGVTISAWVYVTGGSTYLDILSKDGETESRQYLFGVSKNWRFRPHIGTVERLRYYDGALPIENDTWYHAAMTYDVASGELIVYVNGERDGIQVVPEGRRCISVTGEPVRIGGGAPQGIAPLPFYGLIDEVRLYDRALTPDQIGQLNRLEEPDVPPLEAPAPPPPEEPAAP